MTEQNKPVVSFPGQAPAAGENITEGAGSGSEGDTASSANADQFLSKADFEKWQGGFEKELQKRTDKAVTSIREKVNEINNSYKAMMDSTVLTDDQKVLLETERVTKVANIVEDVDESTLPGANDENPAALPVQPGSQSSETEPAAAAKVDPLMALATEAMDEVGARIYADDPEAKLLLESRDKAEYLANAKIAATQKLARLNRDPASLGMVGGAGTQNVMDVESNSALWDEVKKTI